MMTDREQTLREFARSTVFGEVLTDLLEKRGLSADPFAVARLAHEAGLKDSALVHRMIETGVDAGHLDGLAEYLELADEEMVELALAYAFEDRLSRKGAQA